MTLSVRFDNDNSWLFSDPFSLRRNEFVQKLVIKRDNSASPLSSTGNAEPKMRYLFLSVTKDEDGMVTLSFSPPLQLVNLSVFPLDYSFAPPLRLFGQIPPSTLRSFYVDIPTTKVRPHFHSPFLITTSRCF